MVSNNVQWLLTITDEFIKFLRKFKGFVVISHESCEFLMISRGP